MRVGIIVPQGWTGEYEGVAATDARDRMFQVADRAERLGFESLWVYDHFHTTPEPRDTLTFEAYTTLTALAARTSRARLGTIVTCAAYRNPALLAKMLSTMDVLSDGRMEAGIGAGWKEEEYRAYGYEFTPTRERLDRLRETLEVLTRMFEPGRASYDGSHATLDGAINLPAPLQQPRPPIMVGGNGRDVTWRLAARYADELNLDATPPDELPDAMRVLAERCAEIGRDPATLPVSVHIWWEHLDAAPSRAELIAAYREAGVRRVMTLVRESASRPEVLDAFREDCLAGGAELDDAGTTGATGDATGARDREATLAGARH
jgi:F420-dependent oxidoreductase-like protein